MRPFFTVLLAFLALLVLPQSASAQRLDVEFGGGYLFGGAGENPGPSLPVVNVAAVGWLSQEWGVSVGRVAGPSR